MYVQDLNESLVVEDSEGGVDFDGAQMNDPVGAGWGMDDLDAMLLKGMQKKRRQCVPCPAAWHCPHTVRGGAG